MEKKLPYTVNFPDGTNQVSGEFCGALLEEYELLCVTETTTEDESLHIADKMQLIEQLLREYGVEIEYPEYKDNFDIEEDVEDDSDINMPECTLTLDSNINLSEICPM